MILYLIRHAESMNNAIFSGRTTVKERSPDPDITEDGHKQAKLLGNYLVRQDVEPVKPPNSLEKDARFKLTHLYCSLMTRSIQTASYISKEIGLPVVAHPDIYERGGIYQHINGVREGLPGPDKAYFTSRFPDLQLPEGMKEEGWYNQPAETDEVFFERVRRALTDIRQRHVGRDDRVGMVVHGDFIDQFINEALRTPRPTGEVGNYGTGWMANYATNNTSINRIDIGEDYQVLIYLNRVDHLPAELVTW